jgi:hypothetical protein
MVSGVLPARVTQLAPCHCIARAADEPIAPEPVVQALRADVDPLDQQRYNPKLPLGIDVR